MRRPPLLALLVGAAALVPSGVVVRGDEPLIQIDTAYVAETGDGWTIGNPLMQYTLERSGSTVALAVIRDAVDGREWQHGGAPDSVVHINGQRVEVGSAATEFVRAGVSEHWGGVRLDLVYRRPAAGVEITRSYACYPASAVIETWTTFHANANRVVTLAEMTSYVVAVENGPIHWLTGLNTADADGGPFTRAVDELEPGQTFVKGADARSSEQTVPWFSIQGTDSQFFGSILWGGAWRLQMSRDADTLRVQIGLPSFSTSLGAGASLETPHAILGLTNRLVPETSIALRDFIDKGLRHGRSFGSRITYNTWYAHGTFIDEGSLLAEMDQAAEMGVEQFVVDAGWWYGIDPDDPSDFAHSWGTWVVDPERFPNGLGALSDHAHELGMRFGIWVEPERVDLPTVGRPGLAKERFLATRDARYQAGTPNAQAWSANVCLADPEARAWVLGRLTAFIEEARPDYLKWDNNLWVNCNRPNHGHGLEDGNFAQTRGLYMVLDELRDRFPDLEIENCASGGNRLSLDMLAYTDAAWVDDRTTPTTRVRHALEGLTDLFPSSYLLQFVLTTAEEPVTEDPDYDLPYVVRSRMIGTPGLSLLTTEMSEGTRAAIGNQLALFKVLRPMLQQGSVFLLTSQVMDYPDQAPSGWDVVQYLVPSNGDAVLMAFEEGDASASVLIRPKGLKIDADYDVESADFGLLGTVRGRDLMASGIEVPASALTRGHVLMLRAKRGSGLES